MNEFPEQGGLSTAVWAGLTKRIYIECESSLYWTHTNSIYSKDKKEFSEPHVVKLLVKLPRQQKESEWIWPLIYHEWFSKIKIQTGVTHRPINIMEHHAHISPQFVYRTSWSLSYTYYPYPYPDCSFTVRTTQRPYCALPSFLHVCSSELC